ncbi:MAG: response regulator [Halanaerobiales bacterium]
MLLHICRFLPKGGSKIKSVLIVDDAAFMRLNLKNILKEDYEIAGESENGKEAVEMYQELEPDYVTMDITMPVMDGLEAIKAIKDIDPDAQIVVCSAMGQQKMVIQAIESGAQDFIVKPFKEERVINAVKNLED